MKHLIRFVSFAVLASALLFAFVVAQFPAFATGGAGDGLELSSQAQATPPAVQVTVPVPDVEIVPETGAQDDDTRVILPGGLTLWIILGILAVLVIVLLVGLVARGGTADHHHHD